jgi:signal peptidase I
VLRLSRQPPTTQEMALIHFRARGERRSRGTPGAVRAWLRCLLGAVAVCVLGTACCLEACTLVSSAAGWRAEAVLSGSMSPRVQPGDVVLVSAVPATEIKPGQVIAFRDPAMPRVLVHRVVAVLPDGDLRTKGDANAAPDSDPVPPTSVLGVARLRVPFVALPLYWARTGQYGRLILAGAALVGALVLAGSAVSGREVIERKAAHLAGRAVSRRSGRRPSRYPRQAWRHLAVRR